MKIIYLAAIIFAIIGGYATYFFAMQIKENSSIKDVQKANVVIASKDIPANTILTADMLMVAKLPVTSVTGGTVTNIDDVIGYMTRQSIAYGEQLLLSRVAMVGKESSDQSNRLSYNLEKGRFAYCISVDNLQGMCGFLKEGDYIDIYEINAETENKTTLLLQNVKIFRVSNYMANLAQQGGAEITNYSELVLDLNREEIVKLSDAQRSSALRFALVPYAVGAGIADDVVEDLSEKEISTNAPGITVNIPGVSESAAAE